MEPENFLLGLPITLLYIQLRQSYSRQANIYYIVNVVGNRSGARDCTSVPWPCALAENMILLVTMGVDGLSARLV